MASPIVSPVSLEPGTRSRTSTWRSSVASKKRNAAEEELAALRLKQEQELAAMKLQAIYRGKSTRKEVAAKTQVLLAERDDGADDDGAVADGA